MSTSKAAISFDPSLPRTYSDSWREAYGQGTDTPRLSSYQSPDGEPVVFAYDSISLGGGQNIDTVEYPFGFWSNTKLGDKTHTIRIKGHVIGEDYIKQRSVLVAAFQVPTDDDTPGFLELPLWGRFKVVVETWNVDEEKQKNGMSEISLELKRAGYSDTKRLDTAIANLSKQNVDSAVSNLKKVSVASFAKTIEKAKDTNMLASGFGKLTKALANIVGRIQGASSVMNSMVSKINSVTSLIAQGIRAPKELAQAFVSAVYGIVNGVLEIKNAADETASYFMGSDDEDSDSGDSVMEKFIQRNEKNVVMNFLTASNYELSDEAITEQQWNTKKAVENLYRMTAFGAVAQLFVKIDPDTQSFDKQSGLWTLFEKLEESIDKENPDVYAAVEETRIACAQTLLTYSYDRELTRYVRKAMPLLPLALYLGCDDEKIRSLNAMADSFLIEG
ncbi:MAG: DNA circularization N-terminal domain-containing protein, partial [Treponema sp.]|nr:DNA circularization N-terminal domain-containing protein [Treponema sp.]